VTERLSPDLLHPAPPPHLQEDAAAPILDPLVEHVDSRDYDPLCVTKGGVRLQQEHQLLVPLPQPPDVSFSHVPQAAGPPSLLTGRSHFTVAT
jgi:hypothetical protein